MATTNVFRFVSVRPANLSTGAIPTYIRSDLEVDAVNALRQELDAHPGPLEAARLKLGARLLADPAYFENDAIWQKLRLGSTQAAALVVEAQKQLRRDDFRAAVVRLLESALGQQPIDLDAFAASQQFSDLFKTLWRSYYANVLQPNLRPQDREEIVAWIQLFRLIQVASDDVKWQAAAKNATAVRPAVPIEFYRMKVARRPREPGGGGDERPPDEPGRNPPAENPDKGRIEKDKAQLAALLDILAFLKELYSSKTVAFQLIDKIPAVRGPVVKKPPQEGPRAAEKPRTVRNLAALGLDMRDKAPWRLTPDDLRRYQDRFKALRELGFEVQTMNITELIHAVEQRIAQLEAELDQLRLRTRPRLAGLIPVSMSRNIP